MDARSAQRSWLIVVRSIGMQSSTHAVGRLNRRHRNLVRTFGTLGVLIAFLITNSFINWRAESRPLAQRPTDRTIMATSRLAEPLVPVGGVTTPGENRALVKALDSFHARTQPEDLSQLTSFLERYPNSPWRVALLANLGGIYFRSGYPARALEAFGEAWRLGKTATGERARAIVDYAVGEYAVMNARLGRTDALDTIFKEIEGRELSGPGTELIRGAREGRWMMEHQPEEAFLCGPAAVETLAQVLKAQPERPIAESERLKSTRSGTSLAQLSEYAPKLGLKLKLVKREPGAPMITPAVIHWKAGHFAAITRQEGGKFLSEDRTFQQRIWLTQAALDQESSGYALVPADRALPQGWHEIGQQEAAQIWGKGQVDTLDPKATRNKDHNKGGPCTVNTPGGTPTSIEANRPRGMACYRFHTMLASLSIEDIPVAYEPAYGPRMDFAVTYNQREYGQPSAFTFANFGPKWNHNWTAYVVDQPTAPAADAIVYTRGGGSEAYTGFSSAIVSQSTPEQESSAILKRLDSPLRYELVYPDGAKEVYGQSDGATAGNRRFFLTQVVDPIGNAITLSYSTGTNALRLTSITDAAGVVGLNFTYRADDAYKIASITDAYGRSATFGYTTLGGVLRLTSITDPVGIVSSFTYSGDFINKLTTPYGDTTFKTGTLGSSGSYTASSFDYYLEAQDPTGAKERVEYRQYIGNMLSGNQALNNIVNAPVPSGMTVNPYYREYRESFYWDKHAMTQFTGELINGAIQATPTDLTKAHWYHWLHGRTYSQSGYVASPVLEATKAPLESWEFYYYGQSYSSTIMNYERALMRERGQRLDDGTSKIYKYEYNTNGRVTCVTDPLGRKTVYKYAANATDLIEIRQISDPTLACSTTEANQQLLVKYDYFTSGPLVGKHLVEKETDASGRVTTYAYDDKGRVAQVTNPKGEITYYTYVPAGTNGVGKRQKIEQSGPSLTRTTLESYSYDSAARLQTITKSDGYAITYSYDNLDRVTRVTFPDTSYQEVSYVRAADNKMLLDVTQVRDRAGRITKYGYNGNRRLIEQTDANNQTIKFEWCGCGLLQKIIDPRSTATVPVATRWTFDLQGRPTSKIYPDGKTDTFVYETNTSRVKYIQDAKNQRKNFTYLNDDQLKEVKYTDTSGVELPSTPKVTFNYDPAYPRMSSMVDGTGTTTYGYQSIPTTVPAPTTGNGKLVAIDGPLAGTTDRVQFSYDEAGRLKTESIDGTAETVTFDGLGRVAGVANPLGSFGVSFVGATNRPSTISYPNGQVANFTYFTATNDFLPQQVQNLKSGGVHLSTWAASSYDGTKQNLTAGSQRIDSSPTANYAFGYNPLYQMTSGSISIGGITQQSYAYSYDVASNRTSETINGVTSNFSYNGANQITNAGFTYDNNGNLTSDGTRSFQWDAEDRLVAIVNGTNRSEFTYDGIGRYARIVEKSGTTVTSDTRYLWIGSVLKEQRDAAGTTVKKRYYWYGVQDSGANYFYAKDHLGSIREMTDSTGTVQVRYNYDSFGRRTVQTGGTRQADFGRAGYFYHAPSGLYLTRHRAYSPAFAQFLSRDRIGEHGSFYNLYNYASNNGANRVDPSGLFDLRGTDRAGIIVNRSSEPILAFDDYDRDQPDSGQAYIVPPGCTTTIWRDLDYMMAAPPLLNLIDYRVQNPLTGKQDIWYHVRPLKYFGGSKIHPWGLVDQWSVGRRLNPGHVPNGDAEHHMLFDGSTDRWMRERGVKCAACEGGPAPLR